MRADLFLSSMLSHFARTIVCLVTFLAPTLAGAVRFPDVPATYPHREAVEQLSDMDVISGNPDGTFRPTDPVNRAAMLKMLYLAAKRFPERAGGCFPDVASKSWYENYVCDAVLQGFVKGYDNPDGTKSFNPGRPVTRAEAIKMTLAVLGIAEADMEVDVNMYSDVAATDWFARYVHTALAVKLLPIPGQEGPQFAPHTLLERGQAAAYIWNGLQAQVVARLTEVLKNEEVKAQEAEEKVLTELEKKTQATLKVLQHEEDALKKAKENSQSVTAPFGDTRTTSGKSPFAYEFIVTDSQTLAIDVTVLSPSTSGASCRLYHLGKSGFSQEYYLGFEEGLHCTLRVAVSPGNWQLQVLPKAADTKYTVLAKNITGDGNDGFAQAKILQIGNSRTDLLGEGDLEDWFTFAVLADTKTVEAGGRELLIRAIGNTLLGCLVYPMADVDLFGFKGPECGRKYLFPPGNYMVGVRHTGLAGVAQPYTIEVK